MRVLKRIPTEIIKAFELKLMGDERLEKQNRD